MAGVPLWAALVLPASGYAFALATEVVRGGQVIRAQRDAHLAERQAVRDDNRESFERETLVQLLDAVAVLMRNTAKIRHADELAYRETGRWGRDQLNDELGGEESLQFGRDVSRLRVLVLDDDLRDLAERWQFAAAGSTVGSVLDEPDADGYRRSTGQWATCLELYLVLIESIGARIRSLLTADDG